MPFRPGGKEVQPIGEKCEANTRKTSIDFTLMQLYSACIRIEWRVYSNRRWAEGKGGLRHSKCSEFEMRSNGPDHVPRSWKTSRLSPESSYKDEGTPDSGQARPSKALVARSDITLSELVSFYRLKLADNGVFRKALVKLLLPAREEV